MNISLVALVVFLAIGMLVLAIVLAARDLLSPQVEVSGAGKGRPRLRRRARISVPSSATGPVATFDHWFLRTIQQTGMDLSALSATLLSLLIGMALGGAAFVYSESPLLATVAVLIGVVAALGYLAFRARRRMKMLQDQLPDALNMLARGIRAGESLDQAIELVGQKSSEPLAAEFRFASRQLEMGLSLAVVMRSLVDRVRLFDMQVFTTTLTVHRQTGGGLARVLDRLATVIRHRMHYRRQLRATTGAGRFSAILIGMLGPLLFCYLMFWHPKYLNAMLDSSLGQSLLIIAVVLECIGLVWTVRLIKPSY